MSSTGSTKSSSDDIQDLDVTGNRDRRGRRHRCRARDARSEAHSTTVAQPFRTAYPDLDILFFGDRSQADRAVRLRQPAAGLAGGHRGRRPRDPATRLRGREDRTDRDRDRPRAIGTAGLHRSCACRSIRTTSRNAQKKLGGQLALELERTRQLLDARVRDARSSRASLLDDATKRGALIDEGGAHVGRRVVHAAGARRARSTIDLELRFETALDVTDIKRIVRKHLLIARGDRAAARR